MEMYLITLTPFLLAVLDWWFSSKPEYQKLSYLVSRVLDLKDTATIYYFTTDLVF